MKYIDSRLIPAFANAYEKHYYDINDSMYCKYFDPNSLRALNDRMLKHESTIDIIHCKDCELRGSICCPFCNTPDDGFCHQGTMKD